MKKIAVSLFMVSLFMLAAGGQPPPEKPVNKLLYLYRFFYLPFSVDFREGKTQDDVIPFVSIDQSEGPRVMTAEELKRLDAEWKALRQPWAKKSLLATTNVPLNDSVKISNHLMSHRITLSRGAFDASSLNDRMRMQSALDGKSEAVQADFRQMRYLKSFVKPVEEDRLNFFIVSASWCESCREYRILFESYMKEFPNAKVNLHSVVIDDPKEQVFESRLLKDLFPHPAKYSHDSIPRFLTLQTLNGKTEIKEEGDALQTLYGILKEHQGYMDHDTTLFGNPGATPSRYPASVPKKSAKKRPKQPARYAKPAPGINANFGPLAQDRFDPNSPTSNMNRNLANQNQPTTILIQTIRNR